MNADTSSPNDVPMVAYLVLAHRKPAQTVRLVRRIADGSAAVVIHLDAQMSDLDVEAVSQSLHDIPNVHYVPRIRCEWARWSLVQASLDAIAVMLDACPDAAYGILLSGQDYPLKPLDTRQSFLQQANGRSFISHWRLPTAKWHNGFTDAANWKRLVPEGWQPYGGSQWWILSRTCLEHVRLFANHEPEALARLGSVFAPDESFFQTVLCNSPHSSELVNDTARFILWSQAPHPVTLTTRHLDMFRRSPALFARKFDTDVDPFVLDLIDRRLLDLDPVADAAGCKPKIRRAPAMHPLLKLRHVGIGPRRNP